MAKRLGLQRTTRAARWSRREPPCGRRQGDAGPQAPQRGYRQEVGRATITKRWRDRRPRGGAGRPAGEPWRSARQGGATRPNDVAGDGTTTGPCWRRQWCARACAALPRAPTRFELKRGIDAAAAAVSEPAARVRAATSRSRTRSRTSPPSPRRTAGSARSSPRRSPSRQGRCHHR